MFKVAMSKMERFQICLWLLVVCGWTRGLHIFYEVLMDSSHPKVKQKKRRGCKQAERTYSVSFFVIYIQSFIHILIHIYSSARVKR